MRYPKDQKSSSRAKILESASVAFRKKGLAGIGIAELMATAGLTHGGFYSHFESREHLVEECIGHAMTETKNRLSVLASLIKPAVVLEAFANSYLSRRHRDQPEQGCPIPSLGADIGRTSASTRGVFSREFTQMVDLIAEYYRDVPRSVAEQQAIAAMATMVGTVMLARAVDDERLSDHILEAGRQFVLTSSRKAPSRRRTPSKPRTGIRAGRAD
jgi:TetR/AcrR family transcriptional repressor of nem operon